MTTVVYSRNPLNPADRETLCLHGTIASMAPKTTLPFICLVNGDPVLRDQWQRVPEDDDLVVFATLLQGGGGGKNPLRLVATIALAVAAPEIAGALAGVGASAITVSAYAVGVNLVGGALINAVLPSPKLPSSQIGANVSAASPTYSLGSQANTARLGAPVPELFGRHQIYPDLGDQPLIYNPTLKTQNLVQLFVVGQGEYVLSDYKIEDSPIDSFKDYAIYPLGPNQADVLGEDTGIYNVVEVAGQELLGPVEGDTQWIGPFTINPPGKTISRIHVEISFSRGLYSANDSGNLDSITATWTVQARQIDDYGDPIEDWQTLGDESLSAADSAVLRKSNFYDVTSGRYEIRAGRTNAKSTSIRVGNDMLITGVAGISNAAVTDFVQSTTRIQVQLQASDNLNTNTARRFNLIAQRRIPEWNPTTGWSDNVDSRSIVWAFAYVLKRRGIPDSRINLQELYELNQFYAARRMYFDGVFDSKISLFEALTLIARAGRAVPIIQGGQITMVRDSPQIIPVAMFNMRNIVKGSFGTSYVTANEDTPNAVTIDYVDSLTFKPKQVTVIQPDTDGDVVSNVQLFGVTDSDNVELEARYMVATNQYRRRFVKFSTEMDGFIPRFGDVVMISHDLPSWGVSGDILAFDETTLVATLSEPVTFGTGNHYIRLQAKNGEASDPYVVTAGADEFEVVFAELPDPLPYTGGDYEQTRFAFGDSVTVNRLVKIKSIQPRGINTVDISGVIDDSRVYEFAMDDSTIKLSQQPAKYAPDDYSSTYPTASEADLANYAFWSNARGLMSNRDAGYVYQSEI